MITIGQRKDLVKCISKLSNEKMNNNSRIEKLKAGKSYFQSKK